MQILLIWTTTRDLQDSFVDRLELNEKRIDSMISGLDKVQI